MVVQQTGQLGPDGGQNRFLMRTFRPGLDNVQAVMLFTDPFGKHRVPRLCLCMWPAKDFRVHVGRLVCCKLSRNIEKKLESVIHVKLLVTVKQSETFEGGCHIHLDLSKALYQHDVL